MAFRIKIKVTCPKCHESFEYTFIPGVSLTAARFGPYRYMKCQKCEKFALFHITQSLDGRLVRIFMISQAVVGIALAMFGIVLLLLAYGYPASSAGRVWLQIVSAMLFVVAAAMLLLLRAYRTR